MAVTRLLARAEAALDAASTLLIAVCLAAVSVQVVMRYVFNDATTWSDTVASVSLAWLTLLSATAAIRKGANIAVLSLHERLGAPARKAVETFCHLAVLVFALVFLYSGYKLVAVSHGTVVEGLFFHASWAEVYVITVVAGALMVLFTLEKIAALWLVRRP